LPPSLPGFWFENFDGDGVYRTTDANQSLDAPGIFVTPANTTISFQNALDLPTWLAQSSSEAPAYGGQRTEAPSSTALKIAPSKSQTAPDDRIGHQETFQTTNEKVGEPIGYIRHEEMKRQNRKRPARGGEPAG